METIIDWVDLPQVHELQDVCAWLHNWSYAVKQGCPPQPCQEANKACSELVEPSDTSKFSKVYSVVGNRVLLPKQPSVNSPSRWIWSDAAGCKPSIDSTLRIRMDFVEDGVQRQYFGTGFKVSPSFMLTTGHCTSRKVAGVTNVVLKRTFGCFGNPNVPVMWLPTSNLRVPLTPVIEGTSWADDTVSSMGLCQTGSDFSVLEGNLQDGHLLLPCSPRFPGVQDIVILSFPDADGFLAALDQDLAKSEDSKIWQAYKPSMAVEIAEAVQQIAKEENVTVDIVLGSDLLSKAHMQVKQVLCDHLRSTFNGHKTGMMIASVGLVILEPGNNECIGTTASVLEGSSGAAICPLSLLGYFIGIHSGGSRGFDLNIATSTYCYEFCVEYVSRVLPTLPPPDSDFWRPYNLQPFFEWLLHHAHKSNVKSPWIREAYKQKQASRRRHQRS